MAAAAGTYDELPACHNLARVARVIAPAGGIVLGFRVLDEAVAAANWRLASVVAEDVCAGYMASKRQAQALEVARAIQARTDALGYLDREISSRDRRAAPPRLHRTKTRSKKWHPLRELGRVAEARAIVLDCREVFLAANDLAMLMACQDALAKLGDSAA